MGSRIYLKSRPLLRSVDVRIGDPAPPPWTPAVVGFVFVVVGLCGTLIAYSSAR